MTCKSLDQQLIEYRQQRALAMPLAGMIIWSLLFTLSFLLPLSQIVFAVFIGTGSIVYLAMALSKLTGENITFKNKSERNWFESLFFGRNRHELSHLWDQYSIFYGELFSAPFCISSANRADVAHLWGTRCT